MEGEIASFRSGVVKTVFWGSFFTPRTTLSKARLRGNLQIASFHKVSSCPLRNPDGGPGETLLKSESPTGAEGAEADSIFRNYLNPVRLFWCQDFKGAGG